MAIPKDIIRVSDTVREISVTHKEGMRVPGRIVATETLLADFDDGAIGQLEFPAAGTELVFIGPKVEQSRETIEGLFRSCEVR